MESPLTVPHSAISRLRRLEARFLKPHRWAVVLALAGMLLQSALLLPIPLLQGEVVDRLISLSDTSIRPEAAAVTWLIVAALAAAVACYLGKTGLAWWVARTMTRVSLEVVRVLTDAMHRKLQRLPVA
jgi:ABC-type multidrug transport system fused ATPase/permease subunit